MDFPVRYYTTSEFKVTPQGNHKISKKLFAKGTNQIIFGSMNVVEEDVIMRGDLAKISLGNSTIMDSGVIIRPCLSSPIPPYFIFNIALSIDRLR